jgi:hypothetical protein
VTGIDITGALGICTTGVCSIELADSVVGTDSPGESAADVGFPSAGVAKLGCGTTATGPEGCPWNNLPALEEAASIAEDPAWGIAGAAGVSEGGTAFPSAGFDVTCAKVEAVAINGAPKSAGTDGMRSDGIRKFAVGPASRVGSMAVLISVLVAEAGIG